LAQAGHNFEKLGLQNAPLIRVYLNIDAHVTNLTAVRHIGLGDTNVVPIPSDDQGCMGVGALASEMERHDGPKIIIAQAGHINSGAFEDFTAIAALARQHHAWLHVDGAFGMWARVTPTKDHLTKGIDLADSWSIDGHKWLQIPYDSGFAIVRDPNAHRRAMDISASYLNASEEDGRNPTHFNPELSRRARGFATWAVLQSLGRKGVRNLVERHCEMARTVADGIARISGLRVANDVELNQVAVQAEAGSSDVGITRLADRLNAQGNIFVRPTYWKGDLVLRFSVVSLRTTDTAINRLLCSID
jgi:glutamate/tyrosine decarboxylase-like PLP-dependent enzyme